MTKNLFPVLPVLALLALASCVKKTEDTPDPQPQQPAGPLVITKADFAARYKVGGTSFTFFDVANSAVTAPVAGENQTWNFSALAEISTSVKGGSKYYAPTNTAYPSATYAAKDSAAWTVSGATSGRYEGDYFYELSDGGYYDLNHTQNQPVSIVIASLGATINFPVQNVTYTGVTKYPVVLFPVKYGNAAINTNGIINTNNYTVNAAAFGLNNTPGQNKITTNLKQEVIASGTANLKSIGNVRVLVIKSSYSDKTNYFLNGAPTPAALLSQLGATDGAITTGTTYRFVGEGLGTVGIIEVNAAGAVVYATFRKG